MPTGAAAGEAPVVVQRRSSRRGKETGEIFDVVVCGGTVGVFVATALLLRGLKVAIVERGVLKGRVQEWNISRNELMTLVEVGVLEESELDDIISIEFNPNRCGFFGGKDVWVRDILNLGVSPDRLIATVKERFLANGGVLFEQSTLQGVEIWDDVAELRMQVVGSAGIQPPGEGNAKQLTVISTRLVIDAMGNFSPIVKQIRWGKKPDGVCLVVGGCGKGFSNNSSSDIIFTNSPVSRLGDSPMQYFWEAFPAGSGPTDRTTYMFTYMDAAPGRPSLLELLENYWDLMPQYQGVNLDDIEFIRILFAFFPTFRESPLAPAFDRVIQIGDASGIQSPLSFGGFGAMTRHLKRLAGAFTDALEDDSLLRKEMLREINPYQPNISQAWMLQRAMSAPVGSRPPEDFVNKLLSTNFLSMEHLGEDVLRPFLQDVPQLKPLALTMAAMMTSNPALLPQIFSQVGVLPIADWMVHFSGMGLYTLLSVLLSKQLLPLAEKLTSPEQKFILRRRLEAWQFGAGLDYNH